MFDTVQTVGADTSRLWTRDSWLALCRRFGRL